VNARDIVTLLSRHIRFVTPINFRKQNIEARCPFHKGGNEDTPSYYVYVGPNVSAKKTTGSSYCHACGKGWSLRSLLRKLNTPIAEISEVMAMLGVPDYESTSGLARYNKLDFSNPILPGKILGFFDYCPKTLLEQGFEKDTLKFFDIGFDLRYGRITFPLRDPWGNLVGISGRTVIGSNIRYKIYSREVNKPGYTIDKARIVWNIHNVKEIISPDEYLVLTEGFKCAMWAWQQGYKNVACCLGTSVSEEQEEIIAWHTENVCLFLDNDEPGRKATSIVASKLSSRFNVLIARYPKNSFGKSVDDLSKEEVVAAIEGAMTLREWINQSDQPYLHRWGKVKADAQRLLQ